MSQGAKRGGALPGRRFEPPHRTPLDCTLKASGIGHHRRSPNFPQNIRAVPCRLRRRFAGYG
jgi:hypothetical protein